METGGVNILYRGVAHLCAHVPVKKEFREHAFHLGIPKLSVVCFKKGYSFHMFLDLIPVILY